ncbi:MAG: intrarane metalloprotease [Parachlamydiales bacterium]|nr:intrarane metalloprotease [Parachlamydiales bacterium]
MSLSIGNLVGWQNFEAVGMGIGFGLAEFAWHTTAQKVGMLMTGLEVKPSLDPDDGPQVMAFEMLDKEFVPGVIIAPIFEEIVFRGLLQPMASLGMVFCFHQLAAPSLLGLSQASVLSIVGSGIGFGLLHYFNHEQGGTFPATISSLAGIGFGVVRAKLGLAASIGAHMTANLSTGLLDKYWPEFLEFKWEKELRELPPKERELRLLTEAVQRADAAIAQMSKTSTTSEKNELEQLRSNWQHQIKALQAKADY